MWELDYKESWAPKNWCFELWCWQRLLWVLWIARRSNQSILKEINPEYSLEELMLKLKLQYLATDEKSWLIWKDPDAGKDLRQEEQRTTEDVMVGCHHWLNWHEFEKNPGSWWWTWRPGMLQSMGSQRVKHNWVTELNWTEEKLWEKKKKSNALLIWTKRRSNQSILKEISPGISLEGWC